MIPSWSDARIASFKKEFPRFIHCSASPRSKLLRLPNELLLEVFKSVNYLTDAICLSLADGRLFALGFRRIMELHTVCFARWAGNRVVCLGDYTENDDYPASVQSLVNAELLRFSDGDEDDDSLNPADRSSDEGADYGSFYNIASGRYELARTRIEHPNMGSLPYMRLPRRSRRAYLDLSKPEYPEPEKQVLCNLSKGEYVRNEAIQQLSHEGVDRDEQRSCPMYHINLGHALLSRICWSSDPSIAMRYNKDLHRGPWAGDRFEIVPNEKLRPGIEWKDVSDEIVELLRDIWAAENGEWPAEQCTQ